MPYANNQGTRIHYEVEGQGPPLALGHGFSRSLASWRTFGYVEALKKDYRLVMISARGHGNSDKPHDPEAYDLKLRVGDVVAVLDDLGIDRAHYLGYSMGAGIGFGIAKYAPERFLSLMLGGMSPYRTESGDEYRTQIQRSLEGGMEAFVARMEQTSGAVPPEEKARLLTNDVQALLAIRLAASPTDLADALPSLALPCLLWAGDADPFHAGAEECVKHIPNATFVSLPGLVHTQAFTRSDLALPHITSFLAKVSRA